MDGYGLIRFTLRSLVPTNTDFSVTGTTSRYLGGQIPVPISACRRWLLIKGFRRWGIGVMLGIYVAGKGQT